MILTDLSAILLSNTAVSSCGTTRWMSPELIDPSRFNSDGLPSRESDCYALGMVVYEVNSFLSFRTLHLSISRYLAVLYPFITCGLSSLHLQSSEGSVQESPRTPRPLVSLPHYGVFYSRVGVKRVQNDLLPDSCWTTCARPPSLGYRPRR